MSRNLYSAACDTAADAAIAMANTLIASRVDRMEFSSH